MGQQIFAIKNQDQYRKAGPTDLIELEPTPGCNPLFVQKWRLEAFFCGLVHQAIIHLSGPTGSAKTSLIEAMYQTPDNARALCLLLGLPVKPVRIFPVSMVSFDTPGELLSRRALANGTTFDEPSALVQALIAADACRGDAYPVVWLREIGRVHSASIQGGLLDLMTRNRILLPSHPPIDGAGIGWIADSNYQAERDSVHTLVTFDDALKRRFSLNITLDYPTLDQEVLILKRLMLSGDIPAAPDEVVSKVVRLGHAVRRHRSEGNLQSIAPPTIYGYMALFRLARGLPRLSLQQLAMVTLLGNASMEDQKLAAGVFNEVFGLQADAASDAGTTPNLF